MGKLTTNQLNALDWIANAKECIQVYGSDDGEWVVVDRDPAHGSGRLANDTVQSLLKAKVVTRIGYALRVTDKGIAALSEKGQQ